MSETPDSQFIGKWKLSERGMLEGIEIEISKDKKGNFIGLVTKLNDDKYVNMFMEKGDKLLSAIKRNSNFEFVITEKKIAAPLFSAYGQSTTTEFKAVFSGTNKILLGNNGSDGTYLKVK
ncbi:hypothetical protein DIT68_10530 [Brumimicrobium oceani]|uniref:Lipocalin-like domain-containing protein n=2 Tax=Brumimicrobium oceani TaxID=2100725 RepID=A0A2U2XBA6_9FLAO|nr:hypothetical protein DIT68_10530 [Brumimicrobium oceani]